MSQPDGGSAFPRPHAAAHPGATLRDYFAAKSAASIVGVWFSGATLTINEDRVDAMLQLASRLAFKFADAMLIERNKS